MVIENWKNGREHIECTKVGDSYGCKMMHGNMKAKGMNVGEIKIGTILDEISLEAQTNRQNVAGHSLNPKVYNSKYFGHKINYDQNEKLGMFDELFMCVLEMDFPVK